MYNINMSLFVYRLNIICYILLKAKDAGFLGQNSQNNFKSILT
jgi:hypothetical protein